MVKHNEHTIISVTVHYDAENVRHQDDSRSVK